MDPLLVGAVALCSGALAVTAPLAVLMAASASLALLWAHLPGRAPYIVALALLLGWARAAHELDAFTAEHARAREFWRSPQRCAFVGKVTSSPSVLEGTQRFDAQITEVDCEGRAHGGELSARLYGGSVALARGDEFSAIADLGPKSWFRNFDLPDPKPGAAQSGVVVSGTVHALERSVASNGLGASIDRARAHVRGRIDQTFASSVRGMARALVLGENDLTPEDNASFRQSGLSHLLAVSGTHLILAVLASLRALTALLVRWPWLAGRCEVRRLSALAGIALAPLYADFAGGSGSAWRAAFMLMAALGVQALGRRPFPSRVLAASLFSGWLADAFVMFDISFLLSIAATIGLSWFGALGGGAHEPARELTQPRRLDLRKLARLVSDGALTTLAATLPCVPVLLVLAPGVTLASVAANLLAAPLGEAVALPLCLLHTLLAPVPALERGVALVASGALWLIRAVAYASARVEWLAFELPPPGRWHVAVLAVAVAGWFALCGRRWFMPPRGGQQAPCASRAWPPFVRWLWLATGALALLGVELAARRQHSAHFVREEGLLRVTALDVGQGDATLVDLPDGRLMLVDAGGFVGSRLDPGQRVILPSLRARRRDRLDIVVLTHPHPDHFGGLAAVATEIGIGEFWYGGPGARNPDRPRRGPVAELLELLAARGVTLRTARELCGQTLGAPGYSLELLAPCPDVAPDQSANDNSLVLRIGVAGRFALLTGDAEEWAERQLWSQRAERLRADFLKVGHHGSRSSSTEPFIAAVRPRVASISSGSRNRFGHPHAETLSMLARHQVLTLRLDHCGAVRWQTDGQSQGVAHAENCDALAFPPRMAEPPLAGM